MAASTADPASTVLTISRSLPEHDTPAHSTLQLPAHDDGLGAFRGLFFALILQFLLAFVGFAGWMLLRHLR
jgi:hypothetical protein